MRFVSPAASYCGIDLHARTMYRVVLDHAGTARLRRNLPARTAVSERAEDQLVRGCLPHICPVRPTSDSRRPPVVKPGNLGKRTENC